MHTDVSDSVWDVSACDVDKKFGIVTYCWMNYVVHFAGNKQLLVALNATTYLLWMTCCCPWAYSLHSHLIYRPHSMIEADGCSGSSTQSASIFVEAVTNVGISIELKLRQRSFTSSTMACLLSTLDLFNTTTSCWSPWPAVCRAVMLGDDKVIIDWSHKLIAALSTEVDFILRRA